MTKHKLDEHSEIGKISIIQSSILDYTCFLCVMSQKKLSQKLKKTAFPNYRMNTLKWLYDFARKLASGSEDFIQKLVEQLRQGFGFSDSTQRASSDRLQNSAKSLLSSLQLIFIIEIIIKKYGTGHFVPFWIASIFCPIGGRLWNHSDQWEDVLKIFDFLSMVLLHTQSHKSPVGLFLDNRIAWKELSGELSQFTQN